MGIAKLEGIGNIHTTQTKPKSMMNKIKREWS